MCLVSDHIEVQMLTLSVLYVVFSLLLLKICLTLFRTVRLILCSFRRFVGVCIYGLPYINLMLGFSQKSQKELSCECGSFVRSNRFWYTLQLNSLLQKFNRRVSVSILAETGHRPIAKPVKGQ